MVDRKRWTKTRTGRNIRKKEKKRKEKDNGPSSEWNARSRWHKATAGGAAWSARTLILNRIGKKKSKKKKTNWKQEISPKHINMLRLTVRCVMLFCWLVNSFDAPGGPNEWAGLARLSLYYYQKSIEGEKRGKKRAGPKTDREVKRFLMTWSCCCCCWRFFLLSFGQRSFLRLSPPCARKHFHRMIMWWNSN